jgi:formylglycine-generating enzyme required for sulfatase activity
MNTNENPIPFPRGSAKGNSFHLKSPWRLWFRQVFSPATKWRAFGIAAWAVFSFAPSLTLHAADTIVTVCNEATLRTALNKGGTVTLACDGTILLDNTLVITKHVVLDGTGRNVTLDGGGAVRVLLVQTNIQLTLRNVTVARGRADQGGGLLNNGGSVVLLDSVFHSNQAVGNDTNNLAAVGGAVYSIAGEVAVTNSLFATNTAVRGHAGVGPLVAEARGGAIAIQEGVLKLAECQFTTNQAAGGIFLGLMEAKKGAAFGGAVCLQNSEGYVRGCRFDNNLAHSPEPPVGMSMSDRGANVQGGAIHQEGARLLELRDCAFVDNRALGGGGPRNGSNGEGRGGAVSAYGNLVTDHCLFESNTCLGGSGGSFWGGHAFGGALYTTNTSTLNDCLFSANWARAGSGCYCGAPAFGAHGNVGGGAVYAQGTLQILHSTFALNWVEGPDSHGSGGASAYPRPGSSAGGAVFSTSVCVATNSTWFQNRAVAQWQINGGLEGAVAGAAIYQSGNPLTFVHCTIASNAIVSLPTNTSAGIVIGTNAVARLSACILSGNTNANLVGRIVDEGFNLSSDHSVFFAAASSRNDVNPKLGAFGNHGGLTPTLPLLPGSPAIDGAGGAVCPATDQRGEARPAGRACDIGAFELTERDVIIVVAPDQLVRAGADITLTVSAYSMGPLQFQWEKNGLSLPDATNASLTLLGVSPADTADYTVVVSNPMGAQRSLAMRLWVALQCPQISGARNGADYNVFYIADTNLPSQIEYSDDLNRWYPLLGVVISDLGGLITVTDVQALKKGAQRFYRITPSSSLIPAGSFLMGDPLNDSPEFVGERPVHSVSVSSFYMDRYEVTKELWDKVGNWNGGNGYSYDYSYAREGSGKATSLPVTMVCWYDAVKWCNARSQKEGLTPCYYTDSALTKVYKIDRVAPYVKWTANGYRLPTEAEWEKAARGGLSGQRFPWGDTITHSLANYYSSSNDAYDASPTRGYHPSWATGDEPYTSPVGAFGGNGYGLFDMAGNVDEWCWDYWDGNWYGKAGATQDDPKGPSGPKGSRVLRGGSWSNLANASRCAARNDGSPDSAYNSLGFRCARGF